MEVLVEADFGDPEVESRSVDRATERIRWDLLVRWQLKALLVELRFGHLKRRLDNIMPVVADQG